ncbi:hypothetical protein J2Z48_002050 [Croceifilum oryzae]|uniref:Uncharacterized protein n=1 Tax=Croceifilum oryzae TaxID=1553429 RepID=A0AAJ1WUC4_9BACL|nr:hypothetical protein [Croceifilum oryzae]MDQ0417866.1 hypothetical protein [Croceifilum oryzae]
MFERSLRVLPLARSEEGRSGLPYFLAGSLFELWTDIKLRDFYSSKFYFYLLLVNLTD